MDKELIELKKQVAEKTGWDLAHMDLTSYLLEKLPKSIDNGEVNWIDLYFEDDPDCWRAGYEYAKSEKWSDSYDVVADTPLLALLKLTIALSEAGELK